MAKIAGLNSSQNMFLGQRKDFIVMRKDTFSYTGTYTYYDSNNILQTYDFTDCVGKMDIKKKKTDTQPVRVVGVSFNATEYSIGLSGDDMNLDAGRYYYDLQIKDANGNMVTKLYGEIKVLQDVTDFDDVEEKDFLISFMNVLEYYKSINEKCDIYMSEEISYKLIDLGVHRYIIEMLNTIEYEKIEIYMRKTTTINMFTEVSRFIYGLKKKTEINLFNEITYSIYIG